MCRGMDHKATAVSASGRLLLSSGHAVQNARSVGDDRSRLPHPPYGPLPARPGRMCRLTRSYVDGIGEASDSRTNLDRRKNICSTVLVISTMRARSVSSSGHPDCRYVRRMFDIKSLRSPTSFFAIDHNSSSSPSIAVCSDRNTASTPSQLVVRSALSSGRSDRDCSVVHKFAPDPPTRTEASGESAWSCDPRHSGRGGVRPTQPETPPFRTRGGVSPREARLLFLPAAPCRNTVSASPAHAAARGRPARARSRRPSRRGRG